MIHVGNHGHVPDVGLLVHDGTDLIHSEVHLVGESEEFRGRGSFIQAYVHFNNDMCLFIYVHYQISATIPSRVIKRKTCLKLKPSA